MSFSENSSLVIPAKYIATTNDRRFADIWKVKVEERKGTYKHNVYENDLKSFLVTNKNE